MEISNEEAIPKRFKEKVVIVKLDRAAIKRALEAGKRCQGLS